MKFKKYINVLVLIIAVASALACIAGMVWGGGNGPFQFTSVHNESVGIYGYGLYQNDSVSVVAQGSAQDLVTLFGAIPLLIISLILANRGSFRGRVMLTGTLGYFLYSYMSYTFLWNYNSMFLVYVLLMAASIYAFILCLLSFDVQKVPEHFNEKFPYRFLGIFQLCIGVVLCLMWMAKIIPTIGTNIVPAGLEHYTTLVIQGMDLGIIVPAAMLSGVLVLRHRPFGYLLTSVIILKAITMLTSLSAMIISMAMNGVNMAIVEVVMFPAFNAVTVVALIVLMRSIKKKKEMIA